MLISINTTLYTETAQDRVRIIEGEVKSMDSRLSNDIKTLKGVNDVEMDDSGSKGKNAFCNRY